MLDTARADGGSADQRTFSAASHFPLQGRSLALLVRSKKVEIAQAVLQPAQVAALANPAHESPDGARA